MRVSGRLAAGGVPGAGVALDAGSKRQVMGEGLPIARLIRTTATSFAVAVFMLASTFNLSAASLKGVTLPDTVQVGGTTLMLNGLGLRTKFSVKVYVVGLYLDQKSSDPSAIIKADAPKRIVMHFVHTASKSQMSEAFDDSFNDNTPDAKKTMKADIDRLLGALEPVKEGDQMVFTYVPGTGTTLAINGKEKLTSEGPGFGQVLFSVWLGPKPPNAGLKKGILGQ
jgi:chalcone isomerase-like protein